MKENKSEVCDSGINAIYWSIMEGDEEKRIYVFGGNDETMTFKGITFVPDEDESLEEEYLRLREQTEFAGECTVSTKFIRQMQMAIGIYWKGKVPRMRGKRLWWVRNSS